MSKKAWLLCLFFMLPSCKSELPVSPDVHQVGLPVIDYFYANPSQILAGEGSTLFWKVSTLGPFHPPLKIFIHWGYGQSVRVLSVGTMEVYPRTTIIYKLTAYVGTGTSINSVSERVTVSVHKMPFLKDYL